MYRAVESTFQIVHFLQAYLQWVSSLHMEVHNPYSPPWKRIIPTMSKLACLQENFSLASKLPEKLTLSYTGTLSTMGPPPTRRHPALIFFLQRHTFSQRCTEAGRSPRIHPPTSTCPLPTSWPAATGNNVVAAIFTPPPRLP